jgi:VID27 N-terminal region
MRRMRVRRWTMLSLHSTDANCVIAEQERSFLIDEALQFHSGTFEGQTTFLWRDMDDEDDLFEYVATGANGPTVAFFQTSMYKAMYERKYGKSSADTTDEDLQQFAYKWVHPRIFVYILLIIIQFTDSQRVSECLQISR